MYSNVVQEVRMMMLRGFSAAATKHLELFKQKDAAENSFIIKFLSLNISAIHYSSDGHLKS